MTAVVLDSVLAETCGLYIAEQVMYNPQVAANTESKTTSVTR